MEWISVKDVKPEFHKNVLLRYADGAIGIDCRYCWEREFLLEKLYGPVTHWMPLPAQPKEG